MTEEQKESLEFYLTNDYLLINGLLWNEKRSEIDRYIKLINKDGRGCLKEALEQGYQKRWGLNQEDGEKKVALYKRRFPETLNDKTKKQILAQTIKDIDNLKNCLSPLEKEMKLYRNVATKYTKSLILDMEFDYLGFSSCSLQPHIPENKMYGNQNSTLFIVNVPKTFPCIRLDLMKDIQNEPDEIILAPMKYKVKNIDKINNIIEIDCLYPLKIQNVTFDDELQKN